MPSPTSQRIRIPLAGGLNAADDDKNVVPGSFSLLTDVVTTPQGTLKKRTGFTGITNQHQNSTTGATETLVADAIYSDERCLYAKDNNHLHTYLETEGHWSDSQNFYDPQVTTMSGGIVADVTNVGGGIVLEAGDRRFLVHQHESGIVAVTVTNKDSGCFIGTHFLAVGLPYAAYVTQNDIHVIISNGANADAWVALINSDWDAPGTTPFTNSGAINAPAFCPALNVNNNFDYPAVVTTGTQTLLVYKSAALTWTIAKVSTTTGLITSYVTTALPAGPTTIRSLDITLGADLGGGIFEAVTIVASWDSATGTCYRDVYKSTTSVIAPSATARNTYTTAATTSFPQRVAIKYANSLYHYWYVLEDTLTTPSRVYNKMIVNHVDSALTTGFDINLFHLRLASKGFAYNNQAFVHTYYDVRDRTEFNNTSGTLTLLSATALIEGHVNTQTPSHNVVQVSSSRQADGLIWPLHDAGSGKFSFSVGQVTDIRSLGEDSSWIRSTSTARIYQYDFEAQPVAQSLGNVTYFTGWGLKKLVSGTLSPVGWCGLGHVSQCTDFAGAAAPEYAINKIHNFKVVYVHRSAANKLDLSASYVISYTMTANSAGIDIQVPNIPHKDPANCEIRIYKTLSDAGANSPYYEIAGSRTSLGTTTPYTTLTVQDTDTFLGQQVPAYSDSEVDHTAPPACTVLTTYDSRLILAGGELPTGRWLPSKLPDKDWAVQFYDGFEEFVEDARSDITAISDQSGTLLIFTKDSVYTVGGIGPANGITSASAFSLPKKLNTGGIGCISAKSLVKTPIGIFFETHKKLMLLDLGFTINRTVALPINDLITTSVASALDVPSKTQTMFALSGGNGTLVFDYTLNRWYKWSVSSDYYVPFGDKVYRLESNLVDVSDDTVYTDRGNNYSMVFKTPWMAPAQDLSHNIKFRAIYLIGTVQSDSDFDVSIAYNELDYTQYVFPWDTSASADYGTTKVRHRLNFQRASSIQLAFTESVLAAGEGINLTHAYIEFEVYPGLPYTGASNRQGSSHLPPG